MSARLINERPPSYVDEVETWAPQTNKIRRRGGGLLLGGTTRPHTLWAHVGNVAGALADLVRAGTVRYIGSSSCSGSQIVEAQWAARDRRRGRFVTDQRNLDTVEDLAQLADQSGVTLIDMSIAFVLNQPRVMSAIFDPRTTEQLESYLPAADTRLPTDVLDRIEQIVSPGVTVNRDDNSYGVSELTPAAPRS